MKAVVIHGYGGPEVLQYQDHPDPLLGSGEVLIRVAASSVNPFDYKIRSGSVKDRFPLTFPAILGLDVSGVVEAVGPGVRDFNSGDKVFAHGYRTYAELCTVSGSDLAKIPEGMDLIHAAALPTVTTTGAQLAALAHDGEANRTVLITGALGNVGRAAVYAAKRHGAYVIAGVLKRQVAQTESLDVNGVVALDDADALKALPQLDAVADTVDGATADVLLGKIRDGGIFASVLGAPSKAGSYPKVQIKPMQVTADPAVLVLMAEAVRNGKLSIPLGERFSLKDADKAHVMAEKGSSGKIILVV